MDVVSPFLLGFLGFVAFLWVVCGGIALYEVIRIKVGKK